MQMLMVGWDAGLTDDTRRDGAARDRLRRRTLLGRGAAGDWWDRLVRQKELNNAYMVLDLDRHPVPLADRAEHFRRAAAAFVAYGGPGAQPMDPPSAAELADPAYAEPLLIHIAALLRTVDMPATPPQGPGRDRDPGEDITAGQPARRSGSGCCGRCASGNGSAGASWARGRICPFTRTCRWPTRWSRWPRLPPSATRLPPRPVATGHSDLADLASLALQLAPPARPFRPGSPTRCPNTACGLPRLPRLPPTLSVSKSPTVGRAAPTENRTRSG